MWELIHRQDFVKLNCLSICEESGDNGGEVPSFLKKFIKDLKKSSNAKQLGVGVVAGFGTGYVSAKFGKIAAFAIGSSLLLIQVKAKWS